MKNTITLLLLFFSIILTTAQEMDLDNAALETEILHLMNQHRKTLKLTSLEKDVVLQKAAQDQSNYMLKIKRLSHEQTAAAKKHPKNRIQFHGGLDFHTYGENVLYLTVEPKNYAHNDIVLLAQKIYTEWEISPPHYANMISDEYAYASLAFAFDPKSRRLYATTVFGNK